MLILIIPGVWLLVLAMIVALCQAAAHGDAVLTATSGQLGESVSLGQTPACATPPGRTFKRSGRSTRSGRSFDRTSS